MEIIGFNRDGKMLFYRENFEQWETFDTVYWYNMLSFATIGETVFGHIEVIAPSGNTTSKKLPILYYANIVYFKWGPQLTKSAQLFPFT